MGPAFYVIAILGCGEGDVACEEVKLAPARYESMAACTAATEAAMVEHSDVAYPVVVAQCRHGDGSAARLMSGEIDLPEAGSLPGRTRSKAPVFATRASG